MSLQELLMLGIVKNHNGKLILVEWETIKMSNVPFAVSLLTILVGDFAPEGLLNFDSKTGRGVLHHFECFVSFISVLLRVHYSPLFI